MKKEIEANPFFKLIDQSALEQTIDSADNFLKIYNKLVTEYKFDAPDSRGIQKNIMQELLETHIKNEEYEVCAELNEKLKDI